MRQISREQYFKRFPQNRYSEEELLRAGEMMSGPNDDAFDVARAVGMQNGMSWEDATQFAQSLAGQKVQPKVQAPTVQNMQDLRSTPMSSPMKTRPTAQDTINAMYERRLGGRLPALVRGEQQTQQKINAELVMNELRLEAMAEPILKQLQAQGTQVTPETKGRLVERLREMLGDDINKQIARMDQNVQDYVQRRGSMRLAGEALLAAGLGLGAYEYIDAEEVVDPATSRQMQGTLNG